MSTFEQAIELLNSTHTFPARVMVKAIGVNQFGFELRVVEIVRTHLELTEDPPFTVRLSNSDRHIAVTVEPLFQKAEEVLTLYDALRTLEDLVMVM